MVARTEPGLASAVAVRIDGAALPDIVGTLAGEDTIFIAVRDQSRNAAVMKKIWDLFWINRSVGLSVLCDRCGESSV